MVVRVEIRNLEKVVKFMESVPLGVKGEAVQAMADYLLGNESRGLKHYPPYKKVTRKEAYGITFFTAKQRRWFFANLNSGNLKLPYSRTRKLANGWEKIGDKWRPVLRNTVPYAVHVMSDDKQSRMSKKIGWMKMKDNIEHNYKDALKAARLAVRKWLNKKSA